MSQTLKALHYLHNTQKVVHLDLKPENVILDSKCNCVKLIDFGCATTLQASKATTLGDQRSKMSSYPSTEFLAPELLNQHLADIGTYTDMWAFAVLLYVALRYVQINPKNIQFEKLNFLFVSKFQWTVAFPRRFPGRDQQQHHER